MSRFDELVDRASTVFESWAADESTESDIAPIIVRELLAELRKPDMAMISAGMDIWVEEGTVTAIWKAMVDAVLAEAPDDA